jgi:hypothetical protein
MKLYNLFEEVILEEINKKYKEEETKIYDPRTWFDSDVDDKREKLLSDLKKEYYHPEFWKGIVKQYYLNWKKSKTNLSNEKKKELDRDDSIIDKQITNRYSKYIENEWYSYLSLMNYVRMYRMYDTTKESKELNFIYNCINSYL